MKKGFFLKNKPNTFSSAIFLEKNLLIIPSTILFTSIRFYKSSVMSLKTEKEVSTLSHIKLLYVSFPRIKKPPNIFYWCKLKSTMIHLPKPWFRIAERFQKKKKVLNDRTNKWLCSYMNNTIRLNSLQILTFMSRCTIWLSWRYFNPSRICLV